MGFFSKKKKKEQQDENVGQGSNKEVNKAEYKIVLLEKLGGTVRIIKSFHAHRWIDIEDHVVYLKHDKLKFMEIFPQQVNDFKNYTEKEVEKLIKDKQALLEKERDTDSENINDKDIEYDLLKLKAKQRSFKFDDKASYLSFDENARPTFYFLREGSTFFPFKFDTETKNIFIPSDNRKKSASIALRNKENKYDTKKIMDGATILMLIVGFLMMAGGGYMLFKAKQANDASWQAYDQSEIAKAQRACLENINAVAKSVAESAKDVETVVNKVENDLNKPQTVIEGVIPE